MLVTLFIFVGCVALFVAVSFVLRFAPPTLQYRDRRYEAMGVGVAAVSFLLARVAWPRRQISN
jgi:hypothetical protein